MANLRWIMWQNMKEGVAYEYAGVKGAYLPRRKS